MANIRASTRKESDIIGVSIHHSGVEGAEHGDELVSRAIAYDRYHSRKEYNGDGKYDDAQYTGGEYGYKWILYDYLIARDGTVLQVQDLKYVRFNSGDSYRGAESLNLYGVGILLDGNFNEQKPTANQITACEKLIYALELRLGKSLVVKGHKEVAHPSAPTACPGKNMGTSTSGNVKKLIDRVNQRQKNGGLTNTELKAKEKAESVDPHIQEIEGYKNDLRKYKIEVKDLRDSLGDTLNLLEDEAILRAKAEDKSQKYLEKIKVLDNKKIPGLNLRIENLEDEVKALESTRESVLSKILRSLQKWLERSDES